MTIPVAFFLDRLSSHFRARGKGERMKFLKFYEKRMGKKLLPNKLSLWMNLHTCPSFDAGLVMLAYAKKRKIITDSNTPEKLFLYADLPTPDKPTAKHLRRYAAAGRKGA